MSTTIKKLGKPVQNEFELFTKEFTSALQSDISLIKEISQYILNQKSKRIRPLLVLLSAKLCGLPGENTIIAASLVEILHTATLIHDDIIDEALTRRGKPSVNAVWKNKVSVLIGDFLFSRSLTNMLRIRDFEALELLSRTSEALSSGEILQLEKSSNNGMDEENYFRMIWLKTASLFATSCKVGALTVGADQEKADVLYKFGKYLGLAFQVKDDLFDYTATEESIGKPIGRDLKSNLITLPLIHTLNKLSSAENRRIRNLIKIGLQPDDVKEINNLILESGGVEYTKQKLKEISEKACESLAGFHDSDIKQSLLGFIEFNQERIN
ncbi:MAG TPA: polyprenyl synthetase [Candidatus Marinimicrobia bacterium]|nr:polyprenyl synthetase [Candidatus Neomarinimicrobiota bacterium]